MQRCSSVRACVKGSACCGGVAVIDNLVKGASGQALQNLNLMMGVPEEAGLMQLAMFP